MAEKKEQLMEPSYFELQADMDVTKHIGGLRSTKELVELCHIKKGSYVLEVGCGVGMTSRYLAKEVGYRVAAIDISEKMIERANERVEKDRVDVEFRVADAQNIPFKDDLFDAVICESVTAFVKNKKKAVKEYARVTKPGGYIGMNECHWRKKPPKEMVKYTCELLDNVEFLTPDGWRKLLEHAKLKDIVVRTNEVKIIRAFADELGRWELWDFLKTWRRFMSKFISNPAYKEFAAKALSNRKALSQYFKYVGYGIYVGRK